MTNKHEHDHSEHMGHDGHNHAEHAGHDHSEHAGHDHSEHAGHDHSEHAGHDHSAHVGIYKRKFWISLILSIPILLFASVFGREPFFVFPGSDWIVLITATVLFFYGGMPFLQGARDELKVRTPGMMMLVSLGITVSYVYSVYAFIANQMNTDAMVMDFFFELASLIVIMLLGHWIEARAVSSAGSALQRMAELLPNTASVVDADGTVREVELKLVNIGDHVLVKAGEKVPTDGTVVSGSTSVNESLVTGESRAVQKSEGDEVIGGSVNGQGTVTVEVTGTGESGYLSQVMELVSQAQADQSSSETMADRVAKWLFYIAVVVGILAFIVWLIISGDVNLAVERMVTVLVIACPHALGLAIPLVAARSTSLGASNGLLVRSRQALEIAPHVDVVIMDKTGTLTEGNFKVNAVLSSSPDYTDDEVLQLLAALERDSSHPLAEGILRELDQRGLDAPVATQTYNIAGVGIGGTIKDRIVKIVSASYLREHDIAYDQSQFDELAGRGNSMSYLLVDELNIGLVAQGDEIKPQAEDMIRSLKEQGITPVMLTGDNQSSAEVVAEKLGIEDLKAELRPEDKEVIIRDYQGDGHVVMMVGDGVNDAPSLVRADVGVAIGAGTDVAIDSADVILVKSDPSGNLHLLNLAKNTSRKMVQNLWWGAGYNIVALPLAAGVLAPFGIVLTPAIGAIFMSLSTVIVAINAMTLRMD